MSDAMIVFVLGLLWGWACVSTAQALRSLRRTRKQLEAMLAQLEQERTRNAERYARHVARRYTVVEGYDEHVQEALRLITGAQEPRQLEREPHD